MLKIKVLVDNNTIIDKYYTGEPGLSLLLETDGRRILFDTGYSDAFLRNAELMGEDLTNLDAVVISHGHNDHTWGLAHLIQYYDRRFVSHRPALIAHPLAFDRKRANGLEIGMMVSRDVLSSYFDIIEATGPYSITDRLTWLGEIPRVMEPARPLGTRITDGEEADDLCLDDSALVYQNSRGFVVITGCSHSGICNILDHARKVTGRSEVLDVIGGLHMLNVPADRMNEAIAWLEKNPPAVMHPCHCTDLRAKTALSEFFNVGEVGVGLELDYE